MPADFENGRHLYDSCDSAELLARSFVSADDPLMIVGIATVGVLMKGGRVRSA